MTGVRRLVLFRLSSLGDVIHTLPAAVALRETALWDEISWVVEPAFAGMVRAVAGIRPVEVPLRGWRKNALRGVREARSVYRQLREAGCGAVAIDFQGLPKSAVLMGLSGAPVRWTFDADSIRDRAALLFANRRASIGDAKHVIDWNLALASAAAGRTLQAAPLDFSRFVETSGTDAVDVVIHPGSAQARKVWPVERFVELARRLSRTASVTVLWGPGEESRARSIAEASESRLAPPTTLQQMTALLGSCRLFVGGDSGPLHLAAALGRPVVGLYGPTSVLRTGPWRQEKHCVVAADGRMDSISVERVAEAAQSRLQGSE